MKNFRSRALAFYVATLLERVTGDRCRILMHISRRGNENWTIVRYDASGKAVDA